MRCILYLAFLLLLFSSLRLPAQCGLTVDAGPDLAVCPGGGQAQLNASISGPNLAGFSWSPTTGLSDPSVLAPVATVSGEATYTLTAEVFDPTLNLIVNGDFSAGDSDFTTDYEPGSGGSNGLLSNEGEYAVAINSFFTHRGFAFCFDHTGGGNMMVVNGSATAGDNVWCQTVTVQPNTLYAFNAWLMTVVAQNPAELQFSLNGAPLGDSFRAPSSNCNWKQFSETWMSDAATTAEICITNQNTAPSGNDFAIDDLFFGPVCVQTDEVTVREVAVEAQATSPVELTCAAPSTVDLDGTGSSEGALYFYEWTTTNGNIVSGANTLSPTVNQPGIYILTTLYDDGVQQCSDQAFVVVNENQNPTEAGAVIFRSLTCGNPTGELSADGSSTGPDIVYTWTTADGNIVSGADAFNVVIDQPGFYELDVTNTSSGCSEFDFVEVAADDNAPTLAVLPPAEFSCTNTAPFRLDAFDSGTGPNFTANWTTTDGNILEGANTLNPLIDVPGTYLLTVVNTDNGCAATLPVTVGTNTPFIEAFISPPPALDCSAAAAQLDGSGSTATFGATYTWSTADGNIVAGGDTPSANVDAPGTYILLVRDPSSGCSASDTVSVVSNTDLPDIALQSPPPFTCARAIQNLNANGTTTGSGITYRWTANGGAAVTAGANSLEPSVEGAGAYTLVVTNTATGCRRDTTINISANNTPPSANAGAGFTLSCGMTAARLNGSGSGPADFFDYQWSTDNGTFVGPTDTLSPLIGSAGTYLLSVINRETGCATSATVIIRQDDDAPAIMIAPPPVLDCNNPSILLNAAGTALDPDFVREWTTDNGNFVAGTEGLNPEVNAPGTYTLTITDPTSGCTATRSVGVVDNFSEPPAEAGMPLVLNCTITEVRLGGVDFGGGFNYSWSSPEGAFAGDRNRPDPLVSAAGRYFLTVTDPATGCTTVDSVNVVTDDDIPAIDIGPAAATLTCRDTVLQLNEGGAAAANISYAWATNGGNILSGERTPSAAIDGPGTYRLTATDTISGCSGSDAVTVTRDVAPPAINFTPPAALSCNVMMVNLNAGNAGAGQGVSFGWSTTDGNILSGADGPTPSVSAAGEYTLVLTDEANGCTNTGVTVVQQDTVHPVAAILPVTELTCRDSSQILDGRPSDNDIGFDWAWSTADGNFTGDTSGLTPTIDAAGTYTLTVRNLTNGCTTTTETVVSTDQQVPAIEVGPNERILTCTDTVFVLGASAGTVDGLGYAWAEASSGAAGTMSTLNVTTPGTYELVVTDNVNGCTATDEVTVSQNITPPGIQLDPVMNLTCATTERTIRAAPAPAGFTYSAAWTTTDGNITSPANEFEIDVDQPGTYQLVLLDTTNGCTDATQVTVGDDTDPPSANVAFPPFLTCRNTSVQLDGSLSSGGGGFTYNWTTDDGLIQSGASTRTPTVTEAGTYVLTVLDLDNGCTAEASSLVEQNVQLPVLSAEPPAQLNCLVSSVEIMATSNNSGGNALISWSTAEGNIVSGGNTVSPVVDAPGSYVLTVLNQDTRCMSTLEVVVTEDLLEPIVDLGAGFDLGCDAKPVRLEARTEGSGPFAYVWSSTNGMIQDGGTTARPLVQGGGTYAVTVTSETNGCVTVADVELAQNLLLGFDADRSVPGCATPLGSLEFTDVDGGTEPILYSIDGGAGFSTETRYNSLQPGRYALAIQDANGCELTDEIDIPFPPELDLFIDPTVVIALGDAHFINTRTNFADSSLTQISWTPTLGLDCADCLRPTATPNRTTTYVVDVMSSDGCVATDSVRVIVDVRREVYFPTGFSPNGDGVNDVYLPFASLSRVVRVQDFTILDRWGETVFQGSNFPPNNPAFGWDGRLNGRTMNPAVFVFSATVEFVDGRVEVFKGDFALLR